MRLGRVTKPPAMVKSLCMVESMVEGSVVLTSLGRPCPRRLSSSMRSWILGLVKTALPRTKLPASWRRSWSGRGVAGEAQEVFNTAAIDVDGEGDVVAALQCAELAGGGDGLAGEGFG